MADTALIQLIRRARSRAVIMIVVGAGIAATAAAYVAFVARLLAGNVPSLPIAGLGVIPLVIGLPIAISAGARILALRRLEARPEDVVATELALRFGQPGLRFWFAGNRSVVLITGELDRDVLVASLAGRIPEARVVS
jgi:hypothetical protein